MAKFTSSNHRLESAGLNALQIIPGAVRMGNTPLAKESEHLNGFE